MTKLALKTGFFATLLAFPMRQIKDVGLCVLWSSRLAVWSVAGWVPALDAVVLLVVKRCVRWWEFRLRLALHACRVLAGLARESFSNAVTSRVVQQQNAEHDRAVS